MINRVLFKLGLTDVRKASGVSFGLPKKQFHKKGKLILGKEIQFSAYDDGYIELGSDVKICEYSKLLACDGKIVIGDHTQLGDYNYITGQGGVTIQNDVLFASHVNIISNEHKYQDINQPIALQGGIPKPILIKEGSWIGINCTILGGTEIGKNCVVGANSLVKGKFPDYCVIAGSPARIIKKYDAKSAKWINV